MHMIYVHVYVSRLKRLKVNNSPFHVVSNYVCVWAIPSWQKYKLHNLMQINSNSKGVGSDKSMQLVEGLPKLKINPLWGVTLITQEGVCFVKVLWRKYAHEKFFLGVKVLGQISVILVITTVYLSYMFKATY